MSVCLLVLILSIGVTAVASAQQLVVGYMNIQKYQRMSTLSKTPRKRIEHFSYSLSDVIGKGYSSTVYRGRDERTAKAVALKVINLHEVARTALPQLLHAEINIMQHLHHPNILRCEQVLITVNNCYIATELCEGGDLAQLLKTKRKLTQQEAVKIMVGVCEGMKHLKEKGIIHRDIKPANIFLNEGVPKIGDFGFAKKEQDIPKERCRVGSPLYMSPKAINQLEYSHANDIWALGIMFYEMIQGNPPWKVSSQNDLKEIFREKREARMRYLVSNEVSAVIRGCLQFQEEKRMSIEEILQLLNKCSQQLPVNKITRYSSSKCMTPIALASQQKKLQYQKSVKNFLTHFHTPSLQEHPSNLTLQNTAQSSSPVRRKEGVVAERAKRNFRIFKWLINYCRYISKLIPRIQNNLLCLNSSKQPVYRCLGGILVNAIDKLKNFNELRSLFEQVGIREFEEFKETVWYKKMQAVSAEYHVIYHAQIDKLGQKVETAEAVAGFALPVDQALVAVVNALVVDAELHQHNLALHMLLNVLWVNAEIPHKGVESLIQGFLLEKELENVPRSFTMQQLEEILVKKGALVQFINY